MARKRRRYSKWEQRRAKDMFDLMESAEDATSELKGDYMRASAETEQEAVRVAKRFKLSNHLTEKEADAVLRKVGDPEDIKSTLAQMRKSEKGAEIAKEVESPAYSARVKELKDAQRNVNKKARHLFNRTKNKTDEVLEQIAKESFDREAFSIQQQVGEAVPLMMSDADIEKVIHRQWHGKSYSQDIWENTEALADAVKVEMLKSVLTGKSLNKIAQEISKKFGGTYNSARRLVRTEACFVTNQIQLEVFRRAGVEWYIYSAILDERTSEICRGLDGKRYKVKDATVGENFPPMHPWCRSSVVPEMPKNLIDRLKQKARRFWNRITRVSEDLTYNEWKWQYGNADNHQVFSDSFQLYDDELRGLPYESARVYNKDGDLLLEIDGSKTEIAVEGDDVALLDGAVFTHNHPSGGSLSADDLWAMHDSNITQIRAVVEDGTFYANNTTEWSSALSSREAVQSAWDEEFLGVEELANRLAYKGVFGTSRKKYLVYRANMATRNLCRKYGIPYGFEKKR